MRLEMASLVQLSEAIESGKIRFSGDGDQPLNDTNGLPEFNHKNPADWLLRRSGAAGNTEYISLLRKCE